MFLCAYWAAKSTSCLEVHFGGIPILLGIRSVVWEREQGAIVIGTWALEYYTLILFCSGFLLLLLITQKVYTFFSRVYSKAKGPDALKPKTCRLVVGGGWKYLWG